MSKSPELIFEFSANGKASGTTVTARIGDDVLACDKLDVAKSKSRSEFIDSICKGRPGIQRDDVERVLLAHAAEHAKRHTKPDEKPPQPDANELLQKMPQHVRDEARAMLESPNLLGRCYQDISSLGVAGEGELVASIYLVGVSRLLPKPLSVIVQAPSSTGKSYTVEKATSPFPPETIIHATSLTANALYYSNCKSATAITASTTF